MGNCSGEESKKQSGKFHYSWVVCFAGALMLFCTHGYGNNVLPAYVPLLEEMGYSGTQSSALLTLRTVFSMLGMLFIHRVYERMSLKTGLLLSSLMASVGFILMGFGSGYVPYILGAVLLGSAVGIGTTAPVSMLINKWFVTNRSTAFSLCASGTALSVMLLAPLAISVAQNISLSVSFILVGAIGLAVTLVFALLVKNTPQEMGLAPYGAGEQAEEKKASYGGVRVSKRTKYLLYLTLGLCGGVTLATYAHWTVYFTTSGYSKMTATTCTAVAGGFLLVAKIAYGWAADKIGSFKTAMASMLLIIVGSVLLCFAAKSLVFIYVGVILLQCGFPINTVGLTAMASDFSDRDSYAEIIQGCQLVGVVGGILLTPFPGWIYDTTGSYHAAFVLATVAFVFTTALLYFAYRLLWAEHKLEK